MIQNAGYKYLKLSNGPLEQPVLKIKMIDVSYLSVPLETHTENYYDNWVKKIVAYDM